MNVTISVLGRFHAFYLAHQLYKHGHLAQLITSYPIFETKKYGIPRPHITALLSHELIRRGWYKLPNGMKGDTNLQYWFSERFDKAVAKQIPEHTQIFVGWSGSSLHSLQQAKQQGAVTILERGSSHIKHQQEILSEEYEKYGMTPVGLPHPSIVEKEQAEYELADYVSVPSQYVKETFLDRSIPQQKLIQTPYGVSLESFRQLPKRDEVFRVIFAGSITLRKGVHYLLQAFTELELSDAELWLVGSIAPEMIQFLRKYERKNIQCLGHVSQTKLHEYYSQCSVFAICSIEEGLAMVQPQAMVCGLPLICTENTGGADLIEEGKEGFVLPIRDTDALKQKLVYLYEHRELCTYMGQAAKEKVQSGYTWDDYGNKVVQTYKYILDKDKVTNEPKLD